MMYFRWRTTFGTSLWSMDRHFYVLLGWLVQSQHGEELV